MRRTRFEADVCPVARTVDLLGDWWMPLVLRELLLGQDRFTRIQERLDIPRAVLATRLRRLEAEGLVSRVRYEEHPPRDAYRLTPKGEATGDVIMAMWRYGHDWLAGDDEVVVPYDKRTGAPVRPTVIDQTTGLPIELAAVRRRLRTGSGAEPGSGDGGHDRGWNP
ncbi:MAG: helix-turn-helix transcriptional regulator [Acidimicrobiia bacterium]|nr:helix-turn-helix transcriptional regulator [Acidimicrobiia bacterium]MDH4363808.1 helix-turn-helix transcriptional regulator [Acidimicrobiia bacterium]